MDQIGRDQDKVSPGGHSKLSHEESESTRIPGAESVRLMDTEILLSVRKKAFLSISTLLKTQLKILAIFWNFFFN